MQLKAIIVDDELPAREELKYILGKIEGIEIVKECDDGEEVKPMIEATSPDVIFLDIQMRSQDGIVTAGEVLDLPNPPQIVFCTGFSEFAVKAFELNAVDYILKPYSLERVEATVQKLKKFKNFMDNKTETAVLKSGNICVWSSDRIVVLRPAKILFARSDEKRQTMLYTEQGIYHTKSTLKELAEILEPQRFFRTHKSYLVNLDKIEEIIPWFNNTYVLALEDCKETNIPVARHYIKQFNQIMGIL
ncbi:MAG: LytTR family DNA-binding domain-containing protein [Sporomusaceae bacterium]|nr:LytTR family DNA-binding domain-containing protein [Sporomusaceae bacterium]